MKKVVCLLTFALVFCFCAKEQKLDLYGPAYAERWFQKTEKIDSTIAAVHTWNFAALEHRRKYSIDSFISNDSFWLKSIETQLVMKSKYITEIFENLRDSIMVTKSTFVGREDRFYYLTKGGKKIEMGIFLDPDESYLVKFMIIEDGQEHWYGKPRSNVDDWVVFHKQ
ncbi:MAG: hypothetical protein PHT40_03890 [Patescibacteria group bacterium]|nr:hypothetical protein [Patescibacteria group bacterium]